MNKVLSKKKIVNCKRQPKNLKRLLCKSRFDESDRTVNVGVTKCGKPRCATCSNIIECKNYTFKNGSKIEIRSEMNCNSKNVIYAVICNGCNDFYIGQTGNELRKRMTVHRQQMRTDSLRFLNVSKHIHQCSGDLFSVLPIYKLSSNDLIQREIKEKMFITSLKPMLNAV